MKPLPWHDTPKCRDPKCGGPVVLDSELPISPMCGACGVPFKDATPEEKAQIERAEAAWEMVLEGKAHERGCARCGGLLPINRERVCEPCAEAEMRERNLPLFPEMT